MAALVLAAALAVLGAEKTLDGKPIELKAPKGGVLAVVYYSSECPISNGVSPELIAIAKAAPAGRLRMVGICVDFDADEAALRDHAAEYKLNYPCVADRSGRLVRMFGGTMTPEAVVVDDRGTVLYRGRINDDYLERGKRNATPRVKDFRDAVNLALDGKPVPRPWHKAVGCPIPDFPGE